MSIMLLNKTLFVICFIVLASLIVKYRAAKVPFFCDLNDGKQTLKTLYIRRLLIQNNTVHVMIKNSRISFKVPYFFKKQTEINRYEHFFVKSSVVIDNDYKDYLHYNQTHYDEIYGHIEDKSHASVWEIIFNQEKKENLQLQYLNKTGNFERIKTPEPEDMKGRDVDTIIMQLLDRPFDRFTEAKGSGYSQNLKGFMVRRNDKQIEISYKESYEVNPTSFVFNKTNHYDRFATNMLNESYDSRIDNHLLSLFALDTKNHHVFIHQFEENHIEESGFHNYRFDFEDFFGCIRPMRNKNEMKGILSIDNRLFAFIREIYIEIKDPSKFVKSNFKIEPKDYSTAKQLKNFKDIEFEDIKFETNTTKYVKQLSGLGDYLTLHRDAFKIDLQKDELYFTKAIGEDAAIVKCTGQTLNVEGLFVCFKDDIYLSLGSTTTGIGVMSHFNYQTRDIFNMTNVEFGKKEKIQIIFTYKNQTTFLTDKHGYTFDANAIHKIMRGSLSIQSGTKVIKTENCLGGCPPNNIVYNTIRYVTIGILLTVLTFLAGTILRYGKEGKKLIKRTFSRITQEKLQKLTENLNDRTGSQTGSKLSATDIDAKPKSQTGSKTGSETGSKTGSRTGSKQSITGEIDKKTTKTSKSKAGSKLSDADTSSQSSKKSLESKIKKSPKSTSK